MMPENISNKPTPQNKEQADNTLVEPDNAVNKNSSESDPTQDIKETTLLEWSATEFSVYSRGRIYYIASILVFLGVTGYSIYSKDWFIIAIAVILLGFFFWYPTNKPKVANYRITQIGLYVNERVYPYPEINSFYLVLNQKGNSLNVIFNKKYLPQLTVLLPEVEVLKLKAILAKYIPEQEGRTESIVDRVSRLLKL